MARAMFFESNRSAEDGMLAVGTVVANRVTSGRYGGGVCSVVGQRGQFAPGVMSRSMSGEAAERARRIADAVLAGKRHPAVRSAMHFHAAGLRFRYGNMHYVTVAGGNAFYEKRDAATPAQARANAGSYAHALASAKAHRAVAAPVALASIGAPANPAPAPLFRDAGVRLADAAPVPATFVPVPALRGSTPATTSTAAAAVPVPVARGVAPTVVAAAASASVPLPVARGVAPAPVQVAAAPVPLPPPAPAYRSPAPTEAAPHTALAAVAAVRPPAGVRTLDGSSRQGPRVVTITAPVQASMVPVAASEEPKPSPLANIVVAGAWAVIDAFR